MELAMMVGRTREARANFGERASATGALTSALKRSLLLSSALVVAAAILQVPAYAQTSTSPSAQSGLNIAAQPLSRALVQYSNATGVQLFFNANLVRGKNAPALRGSFSTEQAMGRLLAGSGLSYRISGNTVTIVDPNADGNNATATVDGAIALDTIDVSGGGGSAAADLPYQTPGTSAYISAEQIEQVRPSRAGDVFNSTPGVIAASRNTGGAIDVNIRGMQGMGRVKVMVDGTQQESGTYRSYNGTDNRSYFDPDLISGVEIEKGPSDGPYGSGAMGGVVNMKTLTADDILMPGSAYGVRIRGGIGGNTIAPSFNPFMARPESEAPNFLDFDNKFGSLAVASRTEHVDVVAAIVKRQHGNYFAGKYGAEIHNLGNPSNPAATARYSLNLPGEEVPNTSEDTISSLLKGTFKYQDHSLELSYLRQDSKFGYVFPLWAQQRARQQFFLSPNESNRYAAKYKFSPQDNDLIDFRFNVWKTDLSTKDPNQRVVGEWWSVLDTKAWGAEIWNTSQFQTHLGKATLTYGAEYSVSDFSNAYTWPGTVVPRTRGSRELGGTFIRGKLDLTSWLMLNAGIRYDTYRTEAAGGTNALTTNSGDAVLPSAGLTVTPWEGVQFFGKYAEGYRPPAIREIAGTGGESSGWVNRANPFLNPERSTNWEFGVNVLRSSLLREGDKFRLKAAYFDNHYQDYIIPGACPPAVGAGTCYTNNKDAVFKGYELSGGYDARVFFVTSSLNYYTEVDVGSNPDNLRLEFGMGYVPPEFTASGTIGVRLFDEKLTFGTRINYVGQRASPYLYQSLYSTPRFTPHVTLVDLFGSYKFNDSTTVDFSIENLTDQYYVDPLAVARIPSPGRTFRASFSMKLGDQSDASFGGLSIPELTTLATGYNWNGAFVGLDGSYLLGDATAEGDFAGTLRTGSNPNYVWVPYSATTRTAHDPAGLGGGLFAGYNVQLNSPFVLGVDANLTYVNPLEMTEQFTAPAVSDPITRTLTTTVTSSINWQGGVRGRIGLAFGRTLPYVAGGLAIAQYKYNYTSFSLNQSVSTTTLPDPTSFKDTYVGWTFGGGLEHALTDNLLFRAEYRYSDFGKQTFETPAGPHQIDLTSNEWRMGLAYKF